MRSSVGFLMIAGGAFVIVEGMKYFTKPKAAASTSTAVGGSGNSGGTPSGSALSGTAATNAQDRLQIAQNEWADVPNDIKNKINGALDVAGAPSAWAPGLAYIMKRESSYGTNLGNYSAYDAGNGPYGAMQFMKTIWNDTLKYAPNKNAPYSVFALFDQVIMSIVYIRRKYGTPYQTPWFTDTNPWGY